MNIKRFTLIEIVVSVVIFAVVATATATYLRNLLSTVKYPGELIAESNSFHTKIHRLKNYFNENYRNDVPAFKTLFESSAVNANNIFGGQYTITTANYVTITEDLSGDYDIETSTDPTSILLVEIADPETGETGKITFIGED